MTRIAFTLFTMFLALQPLRATTILSFGGDNDRDNDHENERVEAEENTYESGVDLLDDGEWRQAASHFRQVASMRMTHAPAALYWLAYAQNKMGQRSEALSTLLELSKSYPKSKWTEDGKVLEVEIRQSAGQSISPENVNDDELKLMALMGLMQNDPERAIPIAEKMLAGTASPKVKDRALFVLSQSGSKQAYDILVRVARDNGRPELQAKAIRYLGIMGGERSRKALSDVYTSSTDVKIKKSILKSYMISGDRARLLALAKAESNAELRGEAVRQLGILGAKNELSDLYASETAVDIRKQIIQAMFLGGNAEKLSDIARNEKVQELRLVAIRNLGLLGGPRSGQALLAIYESDGSPDVRVAVIKGLFLQSNATALISLARKEKDPSLKKEIVSKISLIHSKESADYLMEYLRE
ncbi:MAG TPA: HEAT repeat domain-containing protein [Thermoanaerobaculia bacterium]|nr:HEAT repeat domain-containing protein [Thermoanaerobaculia bacterium]